MTCARLVIDSDCIATLWLDTPGKSVITLSRQLWSDLAEAIDRIKSADIRGLIIASAKAKSFIVGADLRDLRDMTDGQFDQYILSGLKILDRLEQLPMPTVAAINGACLGGGLELALACKSRICADDPSIQIGLPEVKLCLVPGWGGTVRLTRLIGLLQALPMLISGDPVNPQTAFRMGIVDGVVPPTELVEAARDYAQQAPSQRNQTDSSPADRQRTLADTEAYIRSLGGDQMAASLKLVEIIRKTLDLGEPAGLEAARQGLIELRGSEAAQKRIQQFFDRKAAKKPSATME